MQVHEVTQVHIVHRLLRRLLSDWSPRHTLDLTPFLMYQIWSTLRPKTHCAAERTVAQWAGAYDKVKELRVSFYHLPVLFVIISVISVIISEIRRG